MKILAMYLPQFHRIKENDEWWGEGYTEWDAVKNARKYFPGHREPRIPLNNNYYDLSDTTGTVWAWQSALARKYNIFGFCIYHYWFKTDDQLLEKPMEILLNHPEIDINYCICWANHPWHRTWYGGKRELLKDISYGDESEWRNHFYYLLPFFKDPRYILVNNCPMICIYRTLGIKDLRKMRELWDKLARENGFNGVYIVSARTGEKIDHRDGIMDAYYNYEPAYTYSHNLNTRSKLNIRIKKRIRRLNNRIFFRKKVEAMIPSSLIYEENKKHLWYKTKKCFLGTFAEYDDTPRKRFKGSIYEGNSDLFYNNLCEISHILKLNNREDDFVFVTAWNEWGEGAYLEPDSENRYAYLEAIKKAMDNV